MQQNQPSCQNPEVHAEVTKSPLTSRTNEKQNEALTAAQVPFLMWFMGTFAPSSWGGGISPVIK